MKQLLEEVKQDYDFVLIDAPPVGVVTDASILSTIVDGTVLVCASGQTSIDEARRARELLKNVSANIIGVILNKTSVTRRGYSQYYYYRSYEEDNPKKGKRRGRINGRLAQSHFTQYR